MTYKSWSTSRRAARDSDLIVFLVNCASSPAAMEANSRVAVQVLLLALVVQVSLSQHWSYGWLPGGKRSVGELEATIRVSAHLLWTRRFHIYSVKTHWQKIRQYDLILLIHLYIFMQMCWWVQISGQPCFHLLKSANLLHLDDGYGRRGVSSWRGECSNPGET